MPYTFARLLEDGFSFTGTRKHCRGCGMWLYCFTNGEKKRWLNSTVRFPRGTTEETVYQDHNIRICDEWRLSQRRQA